MKFKTHNVCYLHILSSKFYAILRASSASSLSFYENIFRLLCCRTTTCKKLNCCKTLVLVAYDTKNTLLLICLTFIGFRRCTKIHIHIDSFRVHRSVRPSLCPFQARIQNFSSGWGVQPSEKCCQAKKKTRKREEGFQYLFFFGMVEI